MNPVRKRLRLSPSKHRIISHTAGPSTGRAESPSSSPPHLSHDALPLATGAPAGSGVEEEEGYLVVEEDATDSSLIITMGESTHSSSGLISLNSTNI